MWETLCHNLENFKLFIVLQHTFEDNVEINLSAKILVEIWEVEKGVNSNARVIDDERLLVEIKHDGFHLSIGLEDSFGCQPFQDEPAGDRELLEALVVLGYVMFLDESNERFAESLWADVRDELCERRDGFNYDQRIIFVEQINKLLCYPGPRLTAIWT